MTSQRDETAVCVNDEESRLHVHMLFVSRLEMVRVRSCDDAVSILVAK